MSTNGGGATGATEYDYEVRWRPGTSLDARNQPPEDISQPPNHSVIGQKLIS